ncbi:MFS transporter [Sphingomonas sp. CJ20]
MIRAPTSRSEARAPNSSPAESRSIAFLIVLALAYAGGTIGYLPLIVFLLPIKIAAMAGNATFNLFTATAMAGTVAAIASNLFFGWASDRALRRGIGRRVWLVGGVAGTAMAYALVALATSPLSLILAVLAFQVGVNAILAPALALMADEVPDSQKGLAGGLLALANPIAAGVAGMVVAAPHLGEAGRLAVVAGAVALCTLPLALGRANPIRPAPVTTGGQSLTRFELRIAWVARLLLQFAGNTLTLYLFYYFQSIAPGTAPLALAGYVSAMFALAYVVPLPFALGLGRLSDRIGRRRPFLLGAAAFGAIGLVVMGAAEDRTMGAIGFITYATGTEVFLALHAVFWMQLLPSAAHRGRDLGMLNFANTLPSLIGPALAWLLATPGDFGQLMLPLAALTLGGGLIMLAVREPRAAAQG